MAVIINTTAAARTPNIFPDYSAYLCTLPVFTSSLKRGAHAHGNQIIREIKHRTRIVLLFPSPCVKSGRGLGLTIYWTAVRRTIGFLGLLGPLVQSLLIWDLTSFSPVRKKVEARVSQENDNKVGWVI